MNDVTQILSRMETGDPSAASQLLPLVYDELRKLAAAKLAHEKPGPTLQATALVHEAYLRLVDVEKAQSWNSRGHFFAAAAEAMRRILVDRIRRKRRLRHGGDCVQRERLDVRDLADAQRWDDVLTVDAALDGLAQEDPRAAKLVELRYFAGLTLGEAANVLGISTRSADRVWAYAKAWLYQELRK